MDIRMICMDLDGTALQRDRQSFSPRLTAALEAAHEKGIAIVPVTGRQFGLLPRVLQEHPVWENLAVLCNGGQVRRLGTGEELFRLNIPGEALEGLLVLAQKYDLPIEFSVDSKLYLTQRSLDLQQGIESLSFHRDTILKHNGRIVETLQPLCSQNVEKVNLLCIGEALREDVLRDLKNIPISAVWASSTSMEITHKNAHKGLGVETVCRLLDIPLEQTMALGDSGNDIAMLKTAGLGIAMGNAPDFVKAAADAVTETNEHDGAATAIERYALRR